MMLFITPVVFPKKYGLDNIKTVVDCSRTQFNKVQFNDRFYAFSKEAGFNPIACRPYLPQTKGSVEALARTMDRLHVYNYEFDSINDLINFVAEFCEELNQEVSQATSEIPNNLWLKIEKEHLSFFTENLLTPYFENDIRRIASKESMIQFRKNKYSVNPKYIGYEVILKVSDTNDHQHKTDDDIEAYIEQSLSQYDVL